MQKRMRMPARLRLAMLMFTITLTGGCATTHDQFFTYKGVTWTVYRNLSGSHIREGDKFRLYAENGQAFFIPGRQMTDPSRSFRGGRKIPLIKLTDAAGPYLCATGVRLSTEPGVDKKEHDENDHIIQFRLHPHLTTMVISYAHGTDTSCEGELVHGGRAHAEN